MLRFFPFFSISKCFLLTSFLPLLVIFQYVFSIFSTATAAQNNDIQSPLQSTSDSNSIVQQNPNQHPPILMILTVDGLLSTYDADTGKQLFQTRDKGPAIQGWAEQGMPQYLPSVDGQLYRIDPITSEAMLVESKFIERELSNDDPTFNHQPKSPANSGFFPASNDHAAPDANAFILSYHDSSLVYMDLRTGKVLQEVRHSDPNYKPGPLSSKTNTDPLLVYRRTVAGVRVFEAGTNRLLANASIVYTDPRFFYRNNHFSAIPPTQDSFVAQLKGTKKVEVKNLRTGNTIWLKDMPAEVLEVHGLGGVRVDNTLDNGSNALSEDSVRALPTAPPASGLSIHHDQNIPLHTNTNSNERALVISEHGGSRYASLVRPQDDDIKIPVVDKAEDSNQSTDRITGGQRSQSSNNDQRTYKISNYNEQSANEKVLGRRIARKDPSTILQDELQANPNILSSRDIGMGATIVLLVGIVGYLLGSRPSNENKRKSKKKKHSSNEKRVHGRNGQTSETLTEDGNKLEQIDAENEPLSPNGNDSETHASDDDILNSEEDDNEKDNANPSVNNREAMVESNGSTASNGGVISNRTMSGWMSVGSLEVSSKVLGHGSHGTVVYEGKMMPGDRKVAVKRLLRVFYESAIKEMSLLIQLDEASPHVVRYFAMERDDEFIYLALELCSASLDERVRDGNSPAPPRDFVCGSPPDYTCRALRQLLQGLSDLHRNGVVHRDLKPQNVLITRTQNGHGDIKLADVGLALRLAANRSSYTAVANNAGGIGTTGWRAPEVLSGGRQTKAVDIFAAGCIVSFVLTGGDHPFGNAMFGRDGNIAAGTPKLESLQALGLPEATDIVKKMIDPVVSNRPTAAQALHHPFFWTDAMKLSFLVDISDRLYALRNEMVRYTEMLDRHPLSRTYLSSWLKLLDIELLIGLGRGYENTASGLLRVIRNKRNHYSELSSSLREKVGHIPEDKPNTDDQFKQEALDSSSNAVDNRECKQNYLTYFTSKVPNLLMCVYQYAMENPKLIDEPHFSRYGIKLPETENEVTRRRMRPQSHNVQKSDSLANKEKQEGENNEASGDGNSRETNQVTDKINDDGIETTNEARRTYHRYQLISIQPKSKNLPLYLKSVLDEADIYQPSAYERLKKRLQTNVFEESDFDSEEFTTNRIQLDDDTSANGFQRVTPLRRKPRTSVFSTQHSRTTTSSTLFPPPNRENDDQGTATISQFTGKSRVVDFGSLRNRK